LISRGYPRRPLSKCHPQCHPRRALGAVSVRSAVMASGSCTSPGGILPCGPPLWPKRRCTDAWTRQPRLPSTRAPCACAAIARRRERVRLFTIELHGHFIDAARHLAAATRYLRLITLLIFRRQGLRQQGLQRSD